MDTLLAFLPSLIALAIMLVCSAMFSAAETALFSLSRSQLRDLRRDRTKVNTTIVELMEDPRSLLVLILLNNMIINVTYASVSARVAIQLGLLMGTWAKPVIFELIAVSLLILLGEVTPKALAMRKPLTISRLTAPILLFSRKPLAPLQKFFDNIVTGISAFLLPEKPEKFITDDELNQLLQIAVNTGLLNTSEQRVFSKVLAIRNLRVKEIMQPRAAIVMHRSSDPMSDMMERAEHTRQRVIPVFGETIDDILGVVRVRSVLLSPDKSVQELVEPVFFVPEQKRVDHLLHEFIQTHKRFAVAVDEFGGVAGFLSIDNIIGEIFGELDVESQSDDYLTQIDAHTVDVSGGFALRDLNELLKLDLSAKGLTTVGGFTSHLLGAPPEPGLEAKHKDMTFRIEACEEKRIEKVRITWTQKS